MLVASAANAPVARRRVSIVVPSVLLVSSSIAAVVVPFSTRSFSDTIKALRIDDGITVTGRRIAKPLLCVVFDDDDDVLKVVVKVVKLAFVIMTTTILVSSSKASSFCVTSRGFVSAPKTLPREDAY